VRDAHGRIAGHGPRQHRSKAQGRERGATGKRFLEYGGGFTLTPGDYTLKFLCRENATGKMGTFETRFSVPDVVAEQKYLRLSSVVWANQREPLSAAVGSAERNQKLLADDPLVRTATSWSQHHQGLSHGPGPVRVLRGLRPGRGTHAEDR